MADISVLGKARKDYQPKLPVALRNGALNVALDMGCATESVRDQEKIKALFPNTYGAPYVSVKESKTALESKALNVGVVLSGGQAPGGHNVIAGLFDGIKSINPKSELLGFLGGPSGLENGKFIVINEEIMDSYRNTGGFDIIQSGRTKLETEEQFQKCMAVAKANKLNAIVIIGGDDSNTNAAVLGEYFKAHGASCVVCGCPKTIDGDLKNEYIETSFGFDTAVKTYSELIGNIMRDANSARKYWHFIKLMGRSASHIALEAALQTHPNICLISEEVKGKEMKLKQVIKYVADIVDARAKLGKNFGVCLIPEGLLEFIPDVGVLISELSEAMANHESEVEGLDTAAKVEKLCQWIGKDSAEVLKSLPTFVQAQLMLERDSHGNVQVSLIETEKLIIEMVKKELKSRKDYKGKFSALNHFFGYEGRCAAPSNFDADYCYSLGYTAAVLANNKMNGYMSSVRDLTKGIENWAAGGIPITMMMNMERRNGADKPVIQKALVELNGAPFKFFAKNRETWATTESYTYPGPIQYWGPSEVCDVTNFTIKLERGAMKVE